MKSKKVYPRPSKAQSASGLQYLDFKKVENSDRYQSQSKSRKATTTYKVNVNYPDSLTPIKLVIDYASF